MGVLLMGNTIIAQPKHFTTGVEFVSLPWTAPSDGIIYGYLSASGAANSYGQVRNNTKGINYRLSAHNGYSTSTSWPVSKGDYLTWESGGSGDTLYCYFIAIIP